MARLREEIRQRRHHREFRIGPPLWTEVQRVRLEDLLTAVREAAPDRHSTTPDEPAATPPHEHSTTPPEHNATPPPEDSTPPHEDSTTPSAGHDATRDERGAPAGQPPDEAALATAVTNLWRAQRRLAASGERPSPRDRQASRYLRTSAEALADAGLVVQDHDGDAFNPGRKLEVLVYQENPGLTTETVLETVRPSVYLHGRLVQMGQVIVGTPAQPVDGRNEHA